MPLAIQPSTRSRWRALMDTDVLVGPRIFPSGPVLSQTGGHYDYRTPFE